MKKFMLAVAVVVGICLAVSVLVPVIAVTQEIPLPSWVSKWWINKIDRNTEHFKAGQPSGLCRFDQGKCGIVYPINAAVPTSVPDGFRWQGPLDDGWWDCGPGQPPTCARMPAPGATNDPDAIHVDVAAEISTMAEKVTPASGDWVIIEDSAAGNVKRKVQAGNLGSTQDLVLLMRHHVTDVAASVVDGNLGSSAQEATRIIPKAGSLAYFVIGCVSSAGGKTNTSCVSGNCITTEVWLNGVDVATEACNVNHGQSECVQALATNTAVVAGDVVKGVYSTSANLVATSDCTFEIWADL